ncbi:helix-turn-helix transcriptional regulator [Phosphitispora fastidiosa]|uniref:helix-turn-helix transcriptional regulator n=1 Tax=Phosphitispora fastidiosa TaxID=2837202 RepID=UPI001E2DBA6F|nr:WYL domain-containing protein [Phosphitispora fastidiosa]MBU7006865.1 putative DNA-binding transcriptional regulator YafY [Phosphitispora fastidiosa]
MTEDRKGRNRDRIKALEEIFRDCYTADREISMSQIIEQLILRGISAERRTIYSDIDLLNEIWDYNIERTYRKYKVTRGSGFNEEELQIIIDALLSARFISRENTRELINKLQDTLAVKKEKGALNKIRVQERVKYSNRAIKENISRINEAMRKNKKIGFEYWKYMMGPEPEMVRKDCLASPYGVAWYEDFYYMLGNYQEKRLSYYRIDRMNNVVITEEPRASLYEVMGRHEQLNIGDLLSKLVSPASGDETGISLRVDKAYLAQVRDKFGDRIRVRDENSREAKVDVTVINNKKLIPWILSFREGVEVLYPRELRERIISVIDKMKDKYYDE